MSVDVASHGSVRLITINRPERRNALDPETFLGLGQAFLDAEHDDAVRVVVLTGAGQRHSDRVEDRHFRRMHRLRRQVVIVEVGDESCELSAQRHPGSFREKLCGLS